MVEFVQGFRSRRVHVRTKEYGAAMCNPSMHIAWTVDPAEVLVGDICRRRLKSAPSAVSVASDGGER